MTNDRETGLAFDPKFDSSGLLTVVVTHAETGEVLMVGHMNAEALALTLSSQEVHFWSRSRQSLWKKGESSGNILQLVDMRVDCDQDAIWVRSKPFGPTCHTGAKSCFYRRLTLGGELQRID